MTDAAVRLLSLFNQLDCSTRRVLVEFEEGQNGVLGYLGRIGFFESLLPNVVVLPERPISSAAMRFRGRNPSLVEIERIDRKQRDSSLLNRLTMRSSRYEFITSFRSCLTARMLFVQFHHKENDGDTLHPAERMLDGRHIEDQTGADTGHFHARMGASRRKPA